MNCFQILRNSLGQFLPIPGSCQLLDPTLPHKINSCATTKIQKTEAKTKQNKTLTALSLLTHICELSLQDMICKWSHLKPFFQATCGSHSSTHSLPSFPCCSGGGWSRDSPGLGSSWVCHGFWIPEICVAGLTETGDPFTHQLSLSRCWQSKLLPAPSLSHRSLYQKKG